jgi:hypothetical protein
MFVCQIKEGRKRQTIKGDRKRHARLGETMQLHCGRRSPQRFKIGDVRCVSIAAIGLPLQDHLSRIEGKNGRAMRDTAALNTFAQSDGCNDLDHMAA